VTESDSAPPQKLKQPVSETSVQPGRQLQSQKLSQAVTQSVRAAIELVASLPWGHNIVLMQKVKEVDARLLYARAALEHGWSRAVLTHQIETQLHRRKGKAITNFAATLPAPQSDLAHQTLKDPYIFDFLTMDAGARERDLELGLLNHVQKFLVELGVGFAFVGRQYPLEVSGEEFFLDLLFYHLRLRSRRRPRRSARNRNPFNRGRLSRFSGSAEPISAQRSFMVSAVLYFLILNSDF